MDFDFSAPFFVVLFCFIGLGAILGGLVGIPALADELNFKLLTKTTGVLPSAALRKAAVALVLIIIAASLIFWWVVKLLGDDYDARLDAEKEAALPKIETVPTEPTSKLECALEHYETLGFSKVEEYESETGGESVILSRYSGENSNSWFAEGVTIDHEGESTKFSVGVIFRDGAWAKGDAKLIHRKGLRRRVKLKTVLNSPEFKEISDKNDYVITLGLASRSEDETDEKNLRLAFARAHNLGVAVLKLGWKPESRIWPQTLGYATKITRTDAEALSQRPVILIGVIASRDIDIPDVTFGAMKIIPRDFADLSGYSMPIDKPREPRRITSSSDYLFAKDINLQPSDYKVRTLSAVSNLSPDISCSE